jgi:cytidylate kinase
MIIVCIAREMGSFGDEIGQKVAGMLGGPLLDKAFFEKRCSEFGADAKTLERYDEKKPGFFASFSADQDLYLHMLKGVLFQEALKSSCVVLGRGGNYLLKPLPNCLRIKVVAPRELRIARVATHFNCTEEEATKKVNQSDRDRAGFHHYHFNLDWRDAILNTECLDVENAAAIIKNLCDRLITPAAEQTGATMLKNRIIAQEIAKKILFEKELSIQFLEVQCKEGKATLFGVTGSEVLCRQAKDAAQEIEGVKEVENRIQVIREQPFRRM